MTNLFISLTPKKHSMLNTLITIAYELLNRKKRKPEHFGIK